MRILSIETSADETGVSVITAEGEFPRARYELLGNGLRSQIETHNLYGGIFPAMAKREHAKALVPLLETALDEADLLEPATEPVSQELTADLTRLLEREPEMAEALVSFLNSHTLPEFDLIAVTNGPGLEPALWVGVNFAKALSKLLDCPVIPVNHMEGHILASLFDVEEDDALAQIAFPAVALLISGGHTELITISDWGQYEKIGQTRDDAVGEAFDKVARLLDLPYPGGPAIATLADEARERDLPAFSVKLPHPMLNSGDMDFSFSGLKTAVRYAVQDKELTHDERAALSRDFEDVIATVLIKKVQLALESTGATTLIVGGGVSASRHLRTTITKTLLDSHPQVTVYFPERSMATDNSVMIALAGHARAAGARTAGAIGLIKAEGNRSLAGNNS